MQIKKYIISAALVSAVLGGAATFAFAEDMMPKKPMVIEVSAAGKVLLRGKVKAVATNMLTVTSWGGDWTVNVSSDTKVMPESGLSGIAVGDFVGVQGSVKENAAWTIDATLVRDWTEKQEMHANQQEMKGNQQEIKEFMKAQSPRNWEGVASNVGSNSLTLTVEGTAYTVNVATDAKIVNKKFATTSFTDVKNGDTVRVWGPSSGTTITAHVVRDVSISGE